MKIINLPQDGYSSIIKPADCIDYQSDEFEADFIGRNKKVLLRVKSDIKGFAHQLVSSLFN